MQVQVHKTRKETLGGVKTVRNHVRTSGEITRGATGHTPPKSRPFAIISIIN